MGPELGQRDLDSGDGSRVDHIGPVLVAATSEQEGESVRVIVVGIVG